MNRINKISNDIKSKQIILILIFSFFLLINCITPLMGEDFSLEAIPKNHVLTGETERVTLMAERVYEQMTNWNIRLGEQFSIIFSCYDKLLFNICNSIVTVIYMWLIYQYAFKRKWSRDKEGAFYFLIIATVILTIQPALGEIFFWRTGSTNYLWAICFLLGFALPLRYYIGSDSIDLIGKSRWKTVGMCFWGFLAGFTNENTIAVFILLYVGVIGYNIVKKRKTPRWIYLSGASLVVGFLCLYNAPSTRNRMIYYKKVYDVGVLTPVDYIDRAGNIIERFFHDNIFYVVLTLIIYIAFVLIYLKKGKIQDLWRKSENLGFLLLSSVSCGALIMSPYIETRAFLLPDFMMTVCIVYYMKGIVEVFDRYQNAVKLVLTVGACVGFLYVGSDIYNTYKEYDDYTKLREAAVELEDNDVFIWGDYIKNRDNRILTTREDYLLSNGDTLTEYYGKTIKCNPGYLWKFELYPYAKSDALGNIDAYTYDEASDTLYIWGWAILPDRDGSQGEIYVGIENESGKKYYFKTGVEQRADVATAIGSDNYLDSGFSCAIGNIHDWVETKEGNVTISLCILDEQKEYGGVIDISKKVNIGEVN